jgi:hypothetical protein
MHMLSLGVQPDLEREAPRGPQNGTVGVSTRARRQKCQHNEHGAPPVKRSPTAQQLLEFSQDLGRRVDVGRN